eukprot:TRINITY_DN5213_c0_g2_i1.p1 TRINITY_DN5213_c0_g2~~TRINITY_DN5213_c0_g2_i1.p1  ORF type:complete len:901 (+),score=224.31 TRINITY_DN5213_c0_g2_i1:50-2704(+)
MAVLFKAVAKHEYKKAYDDDLELQKGQIVEVVEADDNGWWRGQIGSRRGMFPASYVRRMEENEAAESAPQSRPSRDGPAPPSMDDFFSDPLFAKTSSTPPPMVIPATVTLNKVAPPVIKQVLTDDIPPPPPVDKEFATAPTPPPLSDSARSTPVPPATAPVTATTAAPSAPAVSAPTSAPVQSDSVARAVAPATPVSEQPTVVHQPPVQVSQPAVIAPAVAPVVVADSVPVAPTAAVLPPAPVALPIPPTPAVVPVTAVAPPVLPAQPAVVSIPPTPEPVAPAIQPLAQLVAVVAPAVATPAPEPVVHAMPAPAAITPPPTVAAPAAMPGFAPDQYQMFQQFQQFQQMLLMQQQQPPTTPQPAMPQQQQYVQGLTPQAAQYMSGMPGVTLPQVGSGYTTVVPSASTAVPASEMYTPQPQPQQSHMRMADDTNQVIAQALQALAQHSPGVTIPSMYASPIDTRNMFASQTRLPAPVPFSFSPSPVRSNTVIATPSHGVASNAASFNSRSSAKCALCDQQEATMNCLQCREMYCSGCTAAIHGKGRFKQHTVVVLGAQLPAQAMQRLGVCAEHGETIAFYCTDDDALVCAHCLLVGSHAGHHSTPLAAATERKQASLHDALTKLQDQLQTMKRSAQEFDDQANVITQTSSFIQAEIQSKMAKMRAVIDMREQALLQAVQDEEANKLELLRNTAGELSEKIDRHGALIRQCESVLNLTDSFKFCTEFGVVAPKVFAFADDVASNTVLESPVDEAFDRHELDVESHVVHLSRLEFTNELQKSDPVMVVDFQLRDDVGADVAAIEQSMRAQLTKSAVSAAMTLSTVSTAKTDVGPKLRFWFDVGRDAADQLENRVLEIQRLLQQDLRLPVASVGTLYFGRTVDLYGRSK